MKTNIEHNIKSQLDERRLNPSESSWNKLSQMMDEEKSQPKTIRFPKWLILAVAASVVICVSIFVINPFEPSEETPVEIADTKKAPSEVSVERNEIISEEAQSGNIQVKEKSISNQTELVQSDVKSGSKIESKQNSGIIQTPVIQAKTSEVNLIQQELKLPEVKKQEEIAAVSEPEPKSQPVEKQKKKSGYVNSEMLLYSVENNQAISETKNDNSRLVIIDFNK